MTEATHLYADLELKTPGEMLDEIVRLTEIVDRYRATLEVIAGSAQDKLQAMQAKAALDNIGADIA